MTRTEHISPQFHPERFATSLRAVDRAGNRIIGNVPGTCYALSHLTMLAHHHSREQSLPTPGLSWTASARIAWARRMDWLHRHPDERWLDHHDAAFAPARAARNQPDTILGSLPPPLVARCPAIAEHATEILLHAEMVGHVELAERALSIALLAHSLATADAQVQGRLLDTLGGDLATINLLWYATGPENTHDIASHIAGHALRHVVPHLSSVDGYTRSCLYAVLGILNATHGDIDAELRGWDSAARAYSLAGALFQRAIPSTPIPTTEVTLAPDRTITLPAEPAARWRTPSRVSKENQQKHLLATTMAARNASATLILYVSVSDA